jgi:hypothetical protein
MVHAVIILERRASAFTENTAMAVNSIFSQYHRQSSGRHHGRYALRSDYGPE